MRERPAGSGRPFARAALPVQVEFGLLSSMLFILRLIHILAGVFWAGAAIFTAAFLIPTIRAVGPAGGPVMQHLAQVRKLPVFILSAGVLTVISGIGLYSISSGGFANSWMRSGAGVTFGIGGVLALVALSLGVMVVMPTTKRIGALAAAIGGSGGKPSPDQVAEMQRLQARMAKASALGSVLIVGATSAMAIARYIP